MTHAELRERVAKAIEPNVAESREDIYGAADNAIYEVREALLETAPCVEFGRCGMTGREHASVFSQHDFRPPAYLAVLEEDDRD